MGPKRLVVPLVSRVLYTGLEVSMDTLVTTSWLDQHLDDEDLVVLDCAVYQEFNDDGSFHNVSGRRQYDEGHIPGAGFADLMGDLSDATSPIEFAVPSPERFCAAMGALGVGDTCRVVLYDENTSMWAARVWWMLRWVGFDRAAILDGGRKAWTDEGRPLSTEPASHPTRQLTPKPRPELIADEREVRDAIGDDAVRLIDTLPPPMFRGDETIYARPGHIPTAVNQCAMDLMDEGGRFRPQEELDTVLEGDRNARAITYCGGGIMASASAFAMSRSGFKDVAVYTASLQEWAANPENPLACGP